MGKIIELSNVVMTPLLRERDYGDWTNKSFTIDMSDSNPTEVSDNGSSLGWDYLSSRTIPLAEDFNCMSSRIMSIIQQISTPGNHLIVTHSGVLNVLYRFSKQLQYHASIPMLSCDNGGVYRLSFNPKNIFQHQWSMSL